MSAPDETAAVSDVLDGQLTLDLEVPDRTGRATTSPRATPAGDVAPSPRTAGQDRA